MNFELKKTPIDGLVVVVPKRFADDRGHFEEIFKSAAFKAAGIPFVCRQVNRSVSKKNVLRGLHFQRSPFAQTKVVQVIKGEIFDVVVDLRPHAPTFGAWYGVTLSSATGEMLFVPKGFAHGFAVLSDEAEVQYFCDEEYAPKFECSLRWDDPALAIAWPMSDVVISEKDRNAKTLAELRREKAI
jgi:dTDP-4-dehydrorhamnose 3,5-epimerase